MYKNLFKLFTSLMFLFSIANAKYTNKLINEDSPYLQQHANNPVNWHAWGKEAFKKAKNENKLIFLSIGYSTCHWCHVMEEESFENEEIAKILNKHYISIKVDREEMPHIDKYYQDVHALLNQRSGGWPLNVILTPNRKAFFAATYIPLSPRYGMIGIKELLNEIHERYTTNTKMAIDIAKEVENILKEQQNIQEIKKQKLDLSLIDQFISEISSVFDHKYGGIGTQPKFPNTPSIINLLDIYTTTKDKKALNLATKMLDSMANGGIYDQIEGGFYRYSVDQAWQIPHFEKMLYTNAELLEAYSKAYKITKKKLYKDMVDGIISFTKERFEQNSLIYSASDADSLINGKKEEGAYYVFSSDDVSDFLKSKGYSQKDIYETLEYFNISFEGNFENGLSNPYLSGNKKPNNIDQIKKELKELRSKKEYPFIDKKILTSWNAMYISSLFEADYINDEYGKDGLKLLNSLLNNLYIDDTLYHQRLINKKPKVKALLEDYTFLIDALIKAYDYSLEDRYLTLGKKFMNEAIDKFYKDEKWYLSDDEFKYPSDSFDSAYKSILSTMLDNLLKIATLSDNLDIQDIAIKTIENNSLVVSSRPSASAWFIRSYLAYKKQYVILKSNKENLLNKKLINYPFILKKIDTSDKYLACKIGVCFEYSNDYNEIIKKIKKEIFTFN